MSKSESNEVTNCRDFMKCIAWAGTGLGLFASACSLQQAAKNVDRY
jgi:hypothetical protein